MPSINYENDIIKWTKQIYTVIEELAKVGLFHKNLNPKNIFIDLNGNIQIFEIGFYDSLKNEKNDDLIQEKINKSLKFVYPKFLEKWSNKKKEEKEGYFYKFYELTSLAFIIYYLYFLSVL